MRRYVKIIVIGYGRIADNVLNHVCCKKADYGYGLEFIEHEVSPFGTARKICRENGIIFSSLPEKSKLVKTLEGVGEETLILSVSNNFIFPRRIIEKKNITIVNFHNALLPKFPGRNAPSWAIYEGEEETGITWHYVTAGVDEGNILLQRKCRIDSDTRAYELAEQLMTLAFEGFCDCFAGIMDRSIQAVPQEIPLHRKVYLAREIPGGGWFNTQDSAADIYRLLRAVDYGKNGIFSTVRAVHEGRGIRILRYRKIQREEEVSKSDERFLYLPLDDVHMLKIKYEFLV